MHVEPTSLCCLLFRGCPRSSTRTDTQLALAGFATRDGDAAVGAMAAGHAACRRLCQAPRVPSRGVRAACCAAWRCCTAALSRGAVPLLTPPLLPQLPEALARARTCGVDPARGRRGHHALRHGPALVGRGGAQVRAGGGGQRGGASVGGDNGGPGGAQGYSRLEACMCSCPSSCPSSCLSCA